MSIHKIPLVGRQHFDVKVPLALENLTVNNLNELYKKLSIGMDQIKEGRVVDADVVILNLKDKYGFHG